MAEAARTDTEYALAVRAAPPVHRIHPGHCLRIGNLTIEAQFSCYSTHVNSSIDCAAPAYANCIPVEERQSGGVVSAAIQTALKTKRMLYPINVFPHLAYGVPLRKDAPGRLRRQGSMRPNPHDPAILEPKITVMKITSEMLQAGIEKATELKVLPRHGVPEDLATNREIMEEILRAALAPDSSSETNAPPQLPDANGSLSQ